MKKFTIFLTIILLTNCSFFKKPNLVLNQFSPTASYDKRVLQLHNTPNHLIYFSDSKEKVTGHISKMDFLQSWYDKKTKKFPDAAVSYYNEAREPKLAIIEITDFRIEEDIVFYDVKILDGKLYSKMFDLSLFIEDEENIADIRLKSK